MCCSTRPRPPPTVPSTSPPQNRLFPFTSNDCRSYINLYRKPFSCSHRVVSAASSTKILVSSLSQRPSVTLSPLARRLLQHQNPTYALDGRVRGRERGVTRSHDHDVVSRLHGPSCSSSARSAVAITSTPRAMSSTLLHSSGAWLTPCRLGTKTIPAGAALATWAVSWVAPLGSTQKGTSRS